MEFSEIARDIHAVILSFRYSIDRPVRAKFLRDVEDRDTYTSTMLRFEEMRIRFSVFNRLQPALTPSEWQIARNELLKSLTSILDDGKLLTSVADRTYRLTAMSERTRSQMNPYILDAFSQDDLDISGALKLLYTIVESAQISSDPRQQSLSFAELDKIVPRQQLAPVQFSILDGKIHVLRQPPIINVEDKANTENALEHILDAGAQLIEGLENSNCDRRLVASVKKLHEQITSVDNIVKIGLSNISCSIMCAQYICEMPDALTAMFNGYSSSVSMYVSQFPEWERFSQKAAELDIDEEDVRELNGAAKDIVEELARNPELADFDVPKTIEFIRSFLELPGATSKRAAFAVLKTVENLVSVIIRFGIEFVNKTADETLDSGSKLASRVIVAMLSVALIGASGVGSVAVRAGTPWVEQAASIVQKHIEKIE